MLLSPFKITETNWIPTFETTSACLYKFNLAQAKPNNRRADRIIDN
jgi:hypothetical protein